MYFCHLHVANLYWCFVFYVVIPIHRYSVLNITRLSALYFSQGKSRTGEHEAAFSW